MAHATSGRAIGITMQHVRGSCRRILPPGICWPSRIQSFLQRSKVAYLFVWCVPNVSLTPCSVARIYSPVHSKLLVTSGIASSLIDNDLRCWGFTGSIFPLRRKYFSREESDKNFPRLSILEEPPRSTSLSNAPNDSRFPFPSPNPGPGFSGRG